MRKLLCMKKQMCTVNVGDLAMVGLASTARSDSESVFSPVGLSDYGFPNINLGNLQPRESLTLNNVRALASS
jgi:hypothetical protein